MSNTWTPHFSVVIPTYCRPRHLSNLLSSLTRLTYQSSMFEVIVVDDGGDTPLEPVISKFRGQINITLLRQENKGPAMARNYGTSQTKGEYLAFTDDDCLPDPNWLQALAYSFRESPCCLCGGKTINIQRKNLYSATTQLRVDYLYERYNPTAKFGAFFLANNLAVSKELFMEMGGFDSTLRFGEDRDFCYRWVSRGYPLVFAPQAVVYHNHSLTFLSFLQLHFLYGGGNFQFLKQCTMKGPRSITLSPPSWYVDLMLLGIKKEKGLRGLFLTLLLMTAQMAYTAGLFWEAVKSHHKHVTNEP